MKRANREINIFSMSALDLFASALGAFIVVSLVLFPYFPNTGEAPPSSIDSASAAGVSPAEIEALRRQLAGAEAELDAVRSRERELAQALDEATSSVQKLPPIDLVIALDTTGSMQREITSLREEIAGLAELLVRLADDAAVGVIDFKDRCDPRTALRIAPLQRVDEQSVGRLVAFARSMRAGSSARCNRTLEEDYAQALRAAVDANWRLESERRSIVMISDNPAHSDMRQQAVADAGRFAGRPGALHTVSSVLVDTTAIALRHPDTVSFMQRVTEAGRGQFVRGDENASLSVTILLAIFDD